MKYCPRCNQRYEDRDLNFCLNDGELLVEQDTSEAPPTLYMDPPRQTRENWAEPQAPPVGQGQQIYGYQQPQQMYQPPMSAMATVSKDTTLPTLSLIFGSIGLLFCCYLGLFLGPASLITGYIGYSRVSRDPQTYGGGTMAIVGMILGGVGFLISLLYIILYILGTLASF